MPDKNPTPEARKHALAGAIGAAILAASGGVAAGQIEEVTVTAQMRAESLKDVPMSVSAFSGDSIKQGNLSSFKDLFALTPGISGETNDSYFDAVTVRGVGNNGFGSGSDPALGLFLDGVYQSREGANPTMFDLDRVEVVKGPQGTLFGRNTASGAISMITRKPGDSFGGEVSVGAGQLGRTDFEGSVDMPVSEDLALRVAGIHRSQDGHIKNLFDGSKLGASETSAARITGVYSGIEDTTITLMAQYEDREGDGTVYRALDTEGHYNQVLNNQHGRDASEIGDMILTLERDFGAVSLTAITGYKTHKYHYIEDFDGTADTIDHYQRDQSGDFFSQELRLTSNTTGPFEWVLGASYYREKLDAYLAGINDENFICSGVMEVEYELDLGASATCAQLALDFPDEMDDAFGTEGDEWEDAPGGLSIEGSDTRGKFSGWGIFANTKYHLTDATNIGLGVRYTRDNKRYRLNAEWPETWTGGWNYYAMYTDGFIENDKTWDNLSGRITLSHDFNQSVTGYASVATGYKSGGFDYLTFEVLDPAFDQDPEAWMEENEWTVDADSARPASFDEEKVLSYELGLKARLLDNRLALNAAAFQYNYRDMQQVFFIGAAAVTRNLGKTTGRGLELDAQWLLSDNLDLYLGMAWLDTEFKGAPEELCEACDGNQMAFAPSFSSAAVLTYRRDTPLGELALATEYTHTGAQYSELENLSELRLDSRNLLNMRLSLTSPQDTWTAGVYVENLTGEEYYHWGYAEADYKLPATQTDPSRGRVAGVNLGYRF